MTVKSRLQPSQLRPEPFGLSGQEQKEENHFSFVQNLDNLALLSTNLHDRLTFVLDIENNLLYLSGARFRLRGRDRSATSEVSLWLAAVGVRPYSFLPSAPFAFRRINPRVILRL